MLPECFHRAASFLIQIVTLALIHLEKANLSKLQQRHRLCCKNTRSLLLVYHSKKSAMTEGSGVAHLDCIESTYKEKQ